jgi:signal transduction histidine kinase
MPRLRDLSLRYKIPLRVTALVTGTALVVAATLVLRESGELKRDLLANAGDLGRVLAETLVGPLMHDDVWRAYEMVSSPFRAGRPPGAHPGVELIMVLDAAGRIYVSSQPGRLPLGADPGQAEPALAGLALAHDSDAKPGPRVLEVSGLGRLLLAHPIVTDGETLGTLVMVYDLEAYAPRFQRLLHTAGLVSLLALIVLLPIAWWWGRRVAAPLLTLADAMGKTGAHLPREAELGLHESGDEIGQLAGAFRRMVAGLRVKQALEEQMVVSERLAALGRLSAGIAHEINNPLGGMLNAISTYQRHGSGDPMTLRTLSLLERGLLQIRDTVGALLVEARIETHPLGAEDLEDVHMLIQPEAQARQAELAWDNGVDEVLPLPSTLVRQVLINLLLNAVHAVGPGGQVACRTAIAEDSLLLEVCNDGAHIPAQDMPYLFEPFSNRGGKGRGLGLWVTYQIVHQLRGEIAVTSEPGRTRFQVRMPLRHPDDSARPA